MDTLHDLGTILAKAGFVGPPLVLSALALWFALGYRFVMLLLVDRSAAFDHVIGARSVRSLLDEVHHGYSLELRRMRGLVSSIVKIAPLLGLLGTVSGMIDTFDSLGAVTGGASQGTGVAGGISEALFSTQLGLLVAIPGLLIGRLLDRRQTTVEDELEKVKDQLGQEAP